MGMPRLRSCQPSCRGWLVQLHRDRSMPDCSAAAGAVEQQHAQALCPCSCRYQDHGFEAASVYAFDGLETGHVSLHGWLLMALYSFNGSVGPGQAHKPVPAVLWEGDAEFLRPPKHSGCP